MDLVNVKRMQFLRPVFDDPVFHIPLCTVMLGVVERGIERRGLLSIDGDEKGGRAVRVRRILRPLGKIQFSYSRRSSHFRARCCLRPAAASVRGQLRARLGRIVARNDRGQGARRDHSHLRGRYRRSASPNSRAHSRHAFKNEFHPARGRQEKWLSQMMRFACRCHFG